MKPIYLIGTGAYLPEKVLTNFDLERTLDTSDEWIVTRTGIRERRVAAPDQAASDLALPACRDALAMAGLQPGDVDLILMTTITPDTHCPAGANWLQAKLNAPDALTFDLAAACCGFIFGLHVADKYLRSGFCRHVLVVASEVLTRATDWTDRSSCILWGDGAGAAVLSVEPRGAAHEMLSVHAHTDGSQGENLLLPGGGSIVTPITHESVDRKRHTIKLIEAAASLRVAVKYFAESVEEAIDANHVTLDDIAWFIPHQANIRIIQALAKRLGVGMDRFYMTIEKYGNISSASCAIALDDAARAGALRPGDLVCLTAFGGGLTWSSALVRW